MRISVVVGRRYVGERQCRRIEQPEADACLEQAFERAVEHGFVEQFAPDGRDDVLGFGAHVVAVVAADQVHAGFERERHAFDGIFDLGKRVVAIDVRRRAAVRDDIAVEAPVARAGVRSIRKSLAQAGTPLTAL